jgi:hypothetical protein
VRRKKKFLFECRNNFCILLLVARMDTDNKLYELLGVARNATDAEIKKVSIDLKKTWIFCLNTKKLTGLNNYRAIANLL